jgi:16S rRNA (adenine1518-N6/adenine1519-N6)-dimethyltransferase
MIFKFFMALIPPKLIKQLLEKYGAAPLKRLGQNFLINKGVLEKIIEAAGLRKEDTILEIGPGLGCLTQELARRTKKVVAIEKDKKFVEILKETLKDSKNIEIINADILKLRNSEISKLGHYKIIANLPYYITSPVIRKFLEEKNKPEEMILMVQKEVAQRICAKPPQMSRLAVSVQFFAEPKIMSYVSKGSFWPQPKVDSSILKITIKKELPEIDSNLFFKIVRAGFSAPRKQLVGNLTKGLNLNRQIISEALRRAKINPQQRAETLNVQDWIRIAVFSDQK